jgi:peptidoglycan/xylan/chitin deacetylase (PgdA/CDA1 family)
MPGSKLFRQNESLLQYWKLLTYEQIAEMSKNDLVTIGSHGYHHNCLERINLDSAKKEILDSMNALESIIHKTVNEIAYPDGTYTSELVDYGISDGLSKHLVGTCRMENTCDASYIHTRMSANPHISFNNQMNAFFVGHY